MTLNFEEERVRPLLDHPHSVVSLSDAGAHVTFFCQAGTGLYLLQHYVRERGDWETAQKMVSLFGMESNTLEEQVLERFKFHFIAGHGGYPLVGSPAGIVEQIKRLSDLGVDGLLLSWVDYLGECRQWIDEVLPLMEAAGLRAPVTPSGVFEERMT